MPWSKAASQLALVIGGGLLLASFPVSSYGLEGDDTAPGDSCSTEDAVRMTANPSGSGGYILTCQSGQWVATLNAALPTEDEQVATKEYVDGAVVGLDACTNNATGLCALESGRATNDPEFTAENIADGVQILGVTGTLSAGGGCTAPASCPRVGDVCSDGSVFIGFMLYGTSCEPLYVTDNNQSTSSQWKTANGTNDITDPDDSVDGQYNRDNRGGGTFPAFELCEDNTYHGKSDWYLPARDELHLLWKNRTAINVSTITNYWSSTENHINGAWLQSFSTGNHGSTNKYNNHAVRCVRRD